jgi:hypothetical protein
MAMVVDVALEMLTQKYEWAQIYAISDVPFKTLTAKCMSTNNYSQ